MTEEQKFVYDLCSRDFLDCHSFDDIKKECEELYAVASAHYYISEDDFWQAIRALALDRARFLKLDNAEKLIECLDVALRII